MSRYDELRKSTTKGVKVRRQKRVDKSIANSKKRKGDYVKTKPSKSDIAYRDNGNLLKKTNATVYGVKKGGGDFSYYDKVAKAGASSVANWEAKQNGYNPYETKYVRTTNQTRTVKPKNGKSFKTDTIMLSNKQKKNMKEYGQLNKPESKLEQNVKKTGKTIWNGTMNTLDFLGTPGHLITGGVSGYLDGLDGDGKTNLKEIKNAMSSAGKNISKSWSNAGNYKGEGKYGFKEIFDSADSLDERAKKNDPKYELKKLSRASTGNGFNRDNLDSKTKSTLNTIGGMGMDIAVPMEFSAPVGTLLKGTGKSFTSVAKTVDVDDVAKTLDKILDGKKISNVKRDVIIHKATQKANKVAGNVDKNTMNGFNVLGKEVISGEGVAKIGDATGISRAFNQIRNLTKKNPGKTNLEDVVANIAKDRLGNTINLTKPLGRTPLAREKEQYDLAMGFSPNFRANQEAKHLDEAFENKTKNIPSNVKPKWALDSDEIDNIQLESPNVKMDNDSVQEYLNRIKNPNVLDTGVFDATDVSSITPMTSANDINTTPGRFKIGKPNSKKQIKEIEKDLGMSIDEFIIQMDKDAQDYALSRLPQDKADFLLDEIGKRNPKVNEMFDDTNFNELDKHINNETLAVQNTPNVNRAEKELEKQSIDALLNIFKKKYNSGDTANYKLPHKQRQDIYVNKMKDLFNSKTIISDDVRKQVSDISEYLNNLGDKKLTEKDKDNIAKALNVTLFDNKPVLRNNMGDSDMKQFLRMIQDGIEDYDAKVPDVLNRGANDYIKSVNTMTDPNSDLKMKYLASKYGGYKKALEKKRDALAIEAKKDPSKHGEYIKAKKALEDRAHEQTIIRDLDEGAWNDYYNKSRGTDRELQGYYDTVNEIGESMSREIDGFYDNTPYSVKDQIKQKEDSKPGATQEVTDKSKNKKYYDDLKNTRKELGLSFIEFRKDKINPIPEKIHKAIPTTKIQTSNGTKVVKDYNRLESVRSSKKNLKKLVDVREKMRMLQGKDISNLKDIPSYNPRIINDMIKQELNYLDAIGVPRDSYVESMQMYVSSYRKSLEKELSSVPLLPETVEQLDPIAKAKKKFSSKNMESYYEDKINNVDEVDEIFNADVEAPLKMNIQMLANQFTGEANELSVGKMNHLTTLDDIIGDAVFEDKTQVLDTGIFDATKSDSLVSMFDDIRSKLPDRKEPDFDMPESIDNELSDFMHNKSFGDGDLKPSEPLTEETIQEQIDKLMGVESKPLEEQITPPRPSTEEINKMAKDSDKTKVNPLSIYDGLLKDFKSNVTVNNLGWHGGNFIQNKLLNAQDIGARAFLPRVEEMKILRGKKGGYTNPVTGEYMDYNTMREYLQEGGIMDNFINKEVQSSSDGNVLSKLFHNVLRPSGKNSVGSGFGLLQKNQDETLAKIQNVMAHMDNGDGILDAMDKAQKTLFDYDDLNKFEKNVAKRIIPFYSYAKKNTMNQLDYLANDQRAHTKLLNAYRNINDEIPSEEKREIKDFEENYLGNRIQIPGMSKEANGRRYDYMLNPKLPFNPVDSADGFENLSPFLNPLVDIAKDENFFGDSIEEPLKYYIDEIKRSYTHPMVKSKQNIDKYKTNNEEFKIPPEIAKILLGISGNYY